jgi:2-polyprenyl-6-methoxyphenol hydroxylase-like FAD-dependent oxidoreductase
MGRALIIGGGVAGTAVAMALQKAGFDPVVYEAYPSGGDDAGAFLTIGANGMFALDQIDATEPVANAGFPLTAVDVSDENGRQIAKLPLGGPPAGIPGHHHLRRAELYRVLQRAARQRGIPVEHGKRLTDAYEQNGAVLASFADGSSASGDLLIGADGLHSTVRQVIDPGADPPRYTGERVFYGYAPDVEPVSDPRTLHMIRGKKGTFGHTVSPAGETWWFARIPGAELSRAQIAKTPPAVWRTELVALFRRDRTPAADVLMDTSEELLASNVYDLPGVASWHYGRMMIIGDAAHAASPASGQGASMALEDAVMLAKSLRDMPNHIEAFDAYEQLRRARVDRVITSGAQLSQRKPPNRIQRSMRNYRSRRQYADPAPGARQWMFDYPLEWDIPVTSEHAAHIAASQRPVT